MTSYRGRSTTLSAPSSVRRRDHRRQLARAQGPDRDLRDDRPHPGRLRGVRPRSRPPCPGDSILFLAGAFCATTKAGDPHLNLAVVADRHRSSPPSLGAQLGYWIGERYGTRLFKPDARIFKTEYLERAQEFFDRRGPRAVVLARFIPFVRTIVPMLAGTGRMPQRKFATANVIGAAIWAVGISLLGYWLGKSIDIDKYILPDRRGDHRACR